MMSVEFALAPSTARCPACDTLLGQLVSADVFIGGCSSCGGLWLDAAACQRLLNGSLSIGSRAFIRHHVGTASELPRGMPYRQRSQPHERPCPICRGPLEQRAVSEPRVTLDVCEHGTFFDTGELTAFLDLEAERAFEAEKEINRLERREDGKRLLLRILEMILPRDRPHRDW